MESSVLFNTTDLSVGYPPALVLFKELNLSLRAGELVCFMGPNGIGKSTLIRTLAGLQKQISGALPPHDEKLLSVVLTDKIVASHMMVSELLTYGRYPYLDWNVSLSRQDQNIIDQAVATVGIENLLGKKLYELSDGQMQMTMIARALAQETPILLLDEPTAHLDLNNRVKIMNLLRTLARKKNKAILVATHELDLALQTADKIWLAMLDKTIKTGIPEDLVLDGSIDNVFQLKGFDLKTGKIEHESHRGMSLRLAGQGPVYLWTKNALERSGFHIGEKSHLKIEVGIDEWSLNGQKVKNIAQLLDLLNQYSTSSSPSL